MVLDAGSPGARSRIRSRLLAMRKLGGKCVGHDNSLGCPWGVDDPRALQFDHINGVSKETGREPPIKMYRNIAHNTAPEGYYQLLCANCNWIKRYECHETRRDHGGEGLRQFRLQIEKNNRKDNPYWHVRRSEFKWPRDIQGIPVQGETVENLCYMIAEERGIDPTTIPDHEYREDARVRFNQPYGYIRPKSGEKYLSPIEHFHNGNVIGITNK